VPPLQEDTTRLEESGDGAHLQKWSEREPWKLSAHLPQPISLQTVRGMCRRPADSGYCLTRTSAPARRDSYQLTARLSTSTHSTECWRKSGPTRRTIAWPGWTYQTRLSRSRTPLLKRQLTTAGRVRTCYWLSATSTPGPLLRSA